MVWTKRYAFYWIFQNIIALKEDRKLPKYLLIDILKALN